MQTESSLVGELAWEANTKYINEAYRSSVVVSLLTLARIWAKSRSNPGAPAQDARLSAPGATLAFSTFKNERTTIEEHVRLSGAACTHIQFDLKNAAGINFAAVLGAGIIRAPRFLYYLVSERGLRAVRRMAYPFLGYCLYRYLLIKFASVEPRGTVMTTNTVHPLSLAAHYAAKAAGWQTVLIEHAMTPRYIAKDRGYSKIFVRSLHTKRMFEDKGVDPASIEVLSYWGEYRSPAPIDPSTLERVGFAVNSLDPLKDVEYVAQKLRQRGLRCEMRVHDADKRLPAFRRFGAQFDIEISSAAGSDIADFVRRQQVVVVGNSSVLLDCLRANVSCIYFWPGPADMYDYYGLVQYARMPSARDRDELLGLLTGRAPH
jgi:hypothetical protein